MRVRSLGLGHAAVRWVCATHKRPLLQLTDMRFRFASKQFVDCHIYQQPATCTCWPGTLLMPHSSAQQVTGSVHGGSLVIVCKMFGHAKPR